MEKIKISKVQVREGEPWWTATDIKVANKALHEVFDFERENLKYIMFKDFYEYEPNGKFLDRLIYTNCLASLLDLTIVEDESIINEASERFYVTMTDNIKMVFKFDIWSWNSYELYSEYLGRGEKLTYSLRESLLLDNADGNVLVLNGFPQHVEKYPNHQFIDYVFKNSEVTATDKITDYAAKANNSWIGAYNMCLVELLSDNAEKDIQKVLNILSKSQYFFCPRPTYKDINLEIVEAVSIKHKDPKILFNALMKSDDPENLTKGLIKLSFKPIL